LDAIVREARKSDREPLMSFIKQVWHGHDYIPRVWDEWIEDESAKMFVVEVDGRPVGMNRIRFLPDGNGWLEGVRIHPDYRGKGLASLLGRTSMEEGRRRGVRTFRLTSSSWNWSAHRQIARMGFTEVSRVSVYSAGGRVKPRPQPGVKVAGPEDAEVVLGLVRRSREFRIGGGVLWDRFAAVSLTDYVVGGLIAEGAVYLSDGAVAIAREGSEGKEPWNQVCFVGGEPDECMSLISHVFAIRGDKGAWRIVYVPQGSHLIERLRKVGMKREFSMILYERRDHQ
jgi:GNAT superfamily N-acetyltransferase